MKLISVLGSSISGSTVAGSCASCGYLKSWLLILENLESIVCLFPAILTFAALLVHCKALGLLQPVEQTAAVALFLVQVDQRAVQASKAEELHP